MTRIRWPDVHGHVAELGHTAAVRAQPAEEDVASVASS